MVSISCTHVLVCCPFLIPFYKSRSAKVSHFLDYFSTFLSALQRIDLLNGGPDLLLDFSLDFIIILQRRCVSHAVVDQNSEAITAASATHHFYLQRRITPLTLLPMVCLPYPMAYFSSRLSIQF